MQSDGAKSECPQSCYNVSLVQCSSARLSTKYCAHHWKSRYLRIAKNSYSDNICFHRAWGRYCSEHFYLHTEKSLLLSYLSKPFTQWDQCHSTCMSRYGCSIIQSTVSYSESLPHCWFWFLDGQANFLKLTPSLPLTTLSGDKMSTITHTYLHKPLRKNKVTICNHHFDSPLQFWPDFCSDDLWAKNKNKNKEYRYGHTWHWMS